MLCPICLGYTSQGGHNCRMTAGARRGSSGRREEAGGGRKAEKKFTKITSWGFGGNTEQGLTLLSEAINALIVVIILDRRTSMRYISCLY